MKKLLAKGVATVFLVSVLLCNYSVAQEIPKNQVGPFEISVKKAAVTHGFNSDILIVSLSLGIKNTTDEPMRYALIKPYTFTFDKGSVFELTDPSALPVFGSYEDCVKEQEKCPVLPPKQATSINMVYSYKYKGKVTEVPLGETGNISGLLFIQNQGTGKGYSLGAGIENIKVDYQVKQR